MDAVNRRVYERDLVGRNTVAGLFDNREDAERAIAELKEAGFTHDQIGIVMRDRTAQGEMVEKTGTHAAEGAATGLIGGGLLGALAGFLIATGALTIPGIGPVVAGGVLAHTFGIVGGTAVAGAGIGAAAGGILGALIGMGIPEHEARHFEEGVRAGRTLVTVTAPGRVAEALTILERNGGDTGANLAAAPVESAAVNTTPVAAATTGDFVVRKRVVTEMETIQVPVTREEVVLERPDGTPVEREPAIAHETEAERAERERRSL